MEKFERRNYFYSFIFAGVLVTSLCLYDGDFLGCGASLEKKIQNEINVDSSKVESSETIIYESSYGLKNYCK